VPKDISPIIRLNTRNPISLKLLHENIMLRPPFQSRDQRIGHGSFDSPVFLNTKALDLSIKLIRKQEKSRFVDNFLVLKTLYQEVKWDFADIL
jgi:hypothetical protein